MRYLAADLQNDVVSVYDKTKTTIAGRVAQKMIGGSNVLGPPLTQFIDVFTASGLLINGVAHATENGRLFMPTAIATGQASILLYSFNYATFAYQYLGRITARFPNVGTTAHTIRGIRAVDTGTTDWKIYVATSAATVTINGGLFCINKVDLANFSTGPSPIDFQFAVTNDAKGVYHTQDPAGLGTANNIANAGTQIMGVGLRADLSQLLLTTGSAATFTGFGFNTAVAPAVQTQAVTAPNSGSATWLAAGHTYAVNDPIVFTTTGTAPGGFTASTVLVHQVYFVRNPVAGVSFELSATSGGASITSSANPTGTATAMRAFGSSVTQFEATRKTGTITSGFVGTALLVDAQRIQTMNDAASPNDGHEIYFIPTASNFYNFRLTDWVAGATTLPTAQAVNNLGTGTDITAPTNTFAQYSQILGKIVYVSASYSFMMKQWVNAQITKVFGGQVNTWLENTGRSADYFRGFAPVGIEINNGVMFALIGTAGQRGVLVMDMRSDVDFDYSYIISKVLNVGPATFKFLATLEKLYDVTDTLTIEYRTAATEGDAIFNTAAGGWNAVSIAEDLSALALNNYVQLKIRFDVLTLLSSIPTQVEDLLIGYDPITESDKEWEGSVDNSSRNGEAPTIIAFRQTEAYSGGPVALRVTAYNKQTGLNVGTWDTDVDTALFDKSTNNGSSWAVMTTGTDYANVPYTTEIRLKPLSLPAERLTFSIKRKP